MIWVNRHSKKFLIAGTALVAFIFTLPYFWPVNAEWYFRNLNWLIPLAIIIFIAPIVPFILSSWDIHFSFQHRDGNLIAIISNYGTNPYNFNRVQFSSDKKYRILSKREFYPKSGLSDENVVFHGAETPSQTLHQHIGCTLKKGLPITLVVRGRQVPENLRHFQKNSKVYLSLYYEGTKQRVYSQRIPPEIVMKIIQNSK
ncbi:hypothetical protein ES703_100298 [subsurface metagenome]